MSPLAGGQYYLQQGRIVPAPDNYRLGYPQLVTMLYTWLMILARPSAAAVLHWAFGALMLLTMLGVSRRFDDPGDAAAPGAAGWLAAAVLLTGETLWLEFGWPYADIAAAAYGFAAVAMLLAWGRGEPHRSGRLLVLAGVLTRRKMGTRHTGQRGAPGGARSPPRRCRCTCGCWCTRAPRGCAPSTRRTMAGRAAGRWPPATRPTRWRA